MKTAIFGGSFNPIHIGHVLTISYLISQGYDQVIVVPCYSHPYGKNLVDFELRMEMCKNSLRSFYKEDNFTFNCYNSLVIVSDIESRLPTPSFTYKTIQALKSKYDTTTQWNLILGSDLKKDFDTWEGADIIKQLAPPVFINRSGYETPGDGPVIIPDVSSTNIRDLIKEDIYSTRLEKLMPVQALDTIRHHSLYR